MTEREKFEAWFENDVVGMKVTFPVFEDGEYAEGDLYDAHLYFTLQAMWMSWKAATASTQEQIAAMSAENSAIKCMNDCLSEELRGYESDGAFEGPKMHLLWWKAETPATDAFIAEQQARSAKAVYESILDNPAITDMGSLVDWIENYASDAIAFAQQLRDEVKP